MAQHHALMPDVQRNGGEVMDIAYHFVGDRLRNGDPVPPDGEWLVWDGPVEMCQSGLHASRHPYDALQYAPGPILCKVEVADICEEAENDKLVCRRRRIIQRGDATEMLRSFARMQALSVVHLWEAPDVVLDFLMTGDESLRDAARDAAWAAARAAAGKKLAATVSDLQKSAIELVKRMAQVGRP